MSRQVLVSASVRVYSAALVVCHPLVRADYATEMRETFAAQCRQADRRGSAAVVALLFREVVDLVRSRLAPPITAGVASPHPIQRRRNPVTSILQDLRYAIRVLRREPTFAAVAIITLALGIGATTAVFTVVSGVLLRPLPYAEPDRIVQLLNGRNGRLSLSFSPPNYRDAVNETGVFTSAAAITPSSANLTGRGDPQQLEGANVTPGFFTVLGVAPQYGRGFTEADGGAGAEPVIVISDRLWRRHFGGDAAIVGSSIRLDGRPFTIIGIAQPDLMLPAGAEYWRPLIFAAADLTEQARGAQYVGVIARMKADLDLPRVESALTTVAARLARDYPRTNKDRAMTAMRLQDRIVRGIRSSLLVLLGAVTLVLLVACVNVANLLLARANGRTREVAVRAALGAQRSRLLQQFLVESLLLGLVGGMFGLIVAFWSVRALAAFGPQDIPRLAEVDVDWRVLTFTVGTAIVTSVLFGLLPALTTSGGALSRFLSSARGAIGPGGARMRKALVVGEMALAVVLLVGAGLLVRSYQRLSNVDPGFSADHVLTFTIGLPEAKYKTGASVSQFVSDYVTKLASQAGVDSAAAVFGLPLDDNFSASSSFTKPGEADSGDSPSVGMRIVTPDYFKALRIPLKQGRLFDGHDTADTQEVVLINQEAARRYWPGEDPIGKQMHLGVRLADAKSTMKTIVGVVGNVKYGGLELNPPPEAYLPHAQHPVAEMTIAVRSAGDPAAFVPIARSELASVDRELPIAAVRTMDEVIGRSILQRRFLMTLLAAFATVAILLAAIGVYGVLAYGVSQRTQEIGLRLAIGAAPHDVVRLFLREGMTLAIVGLVAGIAGALAAGRALTTMLFGVSATDPITFIGVAVALAFAAICASYVPARRAARVDPMVALRTD